MRCEFVPAPDTPAFHAALEARLQQTAAAGTGRRLPVPTSAMRALRHASGYAFHTALAVCLAAALLVLTPGPSRSGPGPSGPEPDSPTAYVRQFGSRNPSAAETARIARDHGYEVGLVRLFVPDRGSDGKVLAITQVGTAAAFPDLEVARGPVLIVVGVAVAAGGTIAT